MSYPPFPSGQIPPQNNAPVKINVDVFVNEAIRTARPLDIGSIWNRSYALVMSDYWTFFIVSIIAGLCMQVIVLNFIAAGGLFYYFIGRARNQRRELRDLFIGFDRMTLPLILAGLIAGVLQGIGYLFCILPGIYLTLIWLFIFELIIDKNLDFWEAMEVSRKAVHHNFGSVLLLFIVGGLISFAGLLACVIGIYFVLPFLYALSTFAYEDLFGGMNRAETPQLELSFQQDNHMNCPQCQAVLPGNALSCPHCGCRFGTLPQGCGISDKVEGYLIPTQATLLSIIAGYLGLFAVLVFPAPFALILGIIALRNIYKRQARGEKIGGKGRAIFAIIMGGLITLLAGIGLLAVVVNG